MRGGVLGVGRAELVGESEVGVEGGFAMGEREAVTVLRLGATGGGTGFGVDGGEVGVEVLVRIDEAGGVEVASEEDASEAATEGEEEALRRSKRPGDESVLENLGL